MSSKSKQHTDKAEKLTNIYLELFLIFFKVGSITFGGGYIMLPFMYRELVISNKWFNNEEIVDIFTVSQSIPGAIAVNAAFNTGFRRAGIIGAFISVAGVVLPAFVAILIILLFFFSIREAVWVRKFLGGVITASAALIFITAINLTRAVLKRTFLINSIITIFVFIAVGVFNINALWMILSGIVFGLGHYTWIKLHRKEVKVNEEEQQ